MKSNDDNPSSLLLDIETTDGSTYDSTATITPPPSLSNNNNNTPISIHERYQPFARNDEYGTCGKNGPSLSYIEWMRIVYKCVIIGKLVCTLALLVILYELLAVVLPFLRNDNQWSKWIIPSYVRMATYIIGFDIVVKGQPRASIMVCNHVSYMDILILMHVCAYDRSTSFVAKQSMKHVFLWGKLASLIGCTFVSHADSSNDTHGDTSTTLLSKLQQISLNQSIIIFPEGTTTNGSYLLPFRTGAFLCPTIPIQPICICYGKQQKFNPSWESIGVWQHVKLLLAQKQHSAEIQFLQPIVQSSVPESATKTKQERKEEAIVYANQVRNIIANAGQLQKSNLVYKDKQRYHLLLREMGYS